MVDFMHFRSACKRQLTAAEFAAADALYVRAYQHTRRHLPSDADSADAAEILRQLFSDVRTPAAASIVARACQAAALGEHSKLLKIALDQIPYLVSQAAHRSLSPAEMRRVRKIHEPWKAASIVLSDAGLSNDDTLALTMGDVSPDGTIATVDSLSTEARLHVRAQHYSRRGNAAGRDEQFIPNPPRAVRDALFAARRDLGLPLHLPRFREGRGQDRWEQMLGVTIMAVNA